jgi:hypothetical protein
MTYEQFDSQMYPQLVIRLFSWSCSESDAHPFCLCDYVNVLHLLKCVLIVMTSDVTTIGLYHEYVVHV